MPFSDRVPSSSWSALTHQGTTLAEAWFKPEGDPLALVFRVSRSSLEHPALRRRLSVEALLRTVGVAGDEVESWRFEDAASETETGLRSLLPALAADASHLVLRVRMKPPITTEVEAPVEPAVPTAPPSALGDVTVTPAQWDDLEARWKAVLATEALIGGLRQSVEGLRGELEAANRASLTAEEKLHALQNDVALWTRAKGRIHHTLPKLREFVHRATWAATLPERKRLQEIVENHIEPRVAFAEIDQVRQEMEHLLKERQVLLAQGNAVYQEGRGEVSETQRALSTLKRNSADRARSKRK